MPSIRPQDRVSLCHFSFADGRRCITPISPGHPHFCFYHAQKEAQSLATEKLGRDLDYFFSGDYLSACDLSAALARLFAAVARGHIKPRAARTLACLAQTLTQTIRLSQNEYISAFGADAWRKAVRSSVTQNSSRDAATPEPPAPAAVPPAECSARSLNRSPNPAATQPSTPPVPTDPPPRANTTSAPHEHAPRADSTAQPL